MDTENQIIKIRVNNFNQSHFTSLGYSFDKNEYILIPAKHLPDGSGIKVKVKCGYCGDIFEKAWRRYKKTKHDVCCSSCRQMKIEKTFLNKYGNKCSLRNDVVLEKSKSTNLKKYGVEYPLQSEYIRQKCFETSLSKYGPSRFGCRSSANQDKIFKLYGGELNHPVWVYFLDIYFKKDGIYFEYDGSGHDLAVKFNSGGREWFESREKKRMLFLKNMKLKEFRIICPDDKLPSDEELLDIKNKAFKMLKKHGYNHYYYYTKNKTESYKM